MTASVNDKRTYPHGVPCWVDTEQSDLDEATRFYGALFGWRFADAVVPKVEAAGGTVVVAPMDIPMAGRFAVFQDHQGAFFSVWQAGAHTGAQLVNEPGTWSWNELNTRDVEGSKAFYSAVFGWETELHTGSGMVRLPGYGDHLASTVDPGIYERQAGAPPGFADVVAGIAVTDRRLGWQVRFSVADRDDSVATAERHGAVVLSSADTPWTREAVIRDPQGAELTLSQFAAPA
jgi:predicted enzyme related to lactoylglutathione lyase